MGRECFRFHFIVHGSYGEHGFAAQNCCALFYAKTFMCCNLYTRSRQLCINIFISIQVSQEKVKEVGQGACKFYFFFMASKIVIFTQVAVLLASPLMVLKAPTYSILIRLSFGDKCAEEMENPHQKFCCIDALPTAHSL